jgi:hypothetical protein
VTALSDIRRYPARQILSVIANIQTPAKPKAVFRSGNLNPSLRHCYALHSCREIASHAPSQEERKTRLSLFTPTSEANGMLHSFCHGKSHLYRRYLGHRDVGEKRVCEEDEITSLIMGPLDYLPSEASGSFWRALIERDVGEELALPSGPISRVQMKFWPRRTIEPDLLVELHWPTGEHRIVLVEFKWNAPLSGNDQLHRQWNEFLTHAERKIAHHVFIAPEISAGLNAMSQDNIWKGRLILRSWINILDVLKQLDCSRDAGLEKWKFQVTTLLGNLGIRRFQGFRDLSPPPSLQQSPSFWSPINGFKKLEPPVCPTLKTQLPSFIWSSEQ